MDVSIYKDEEAVASAGAEMMRDLLVRKPQAVLGLASGSTPLRLYRQLIADCQRGDVSFRDVTTFNLDEYIGLAADSPFGYRSFMQRELFDHIDIDVGNTFLPECLNETDCVTAATAYETRIHDCGGIDLQILGIGQNGHIGFNEPTSSLSSRTRIKTLTRETVEANQQYFDTLADQPHTALTMGIGTIMDARQVLLLATGAEKAAAVQAFVEGPVSAMCPASALQMHTSVTVLLDEQAAAELSLRDYYAWIAEQKLHLSKQSQET